jgi:ATP-binding cassette, subfamily G (WHITE), member 2, SNQ2
MPLQMIGRPVLRKQTGYSLYRPSAHVIANTLAVRAPYLCRCLTPYTSHAQDLPLSAVRVLIFDTIIYFMAHLSWNPGAFFTFHLINYMTYLTLQGFFRMLGHLCVNFYSAFRLAIFCIPIIVQV